MSDCGVGGALLIFSHTHLTPHNFRVCPPLKSPSKIFQNMPNFNTKKLKTYLLLSFQVTLFPNVNIEKGFFGAVPKAENDRNNYLDRILPNFYRTGTDFLSRILRLLYVTHKLNKMILLHCVSNRKNYASNLEEFL